MPKNWSRAQIARVRARAEGGDPSAQREFATMLASGALGAPNHQQAFKWYLKAAEAGDDDAQYNLGLMYILGEGVRKSRDTGLRWLKAAASRKNDVAEEVLGEIYDRGAFGFRKNIRIAMKWYRAAAARGNSKAKFGLGLCLSLKGTPSQKREGAKLIRQAAKAGVVDAKKYLATQRHRAHG